MNNDLCSLFFPAGKAAKIRMLVLDVDGVLTDGGLYYDLQNQIMKRFNVHDGFGIKLAMASGIGISVITGLVSAAVENRVKDLGIQDYYAGYQDKRSCLLEIKQRHNLDWDEIAYLGDDWVDLAVMNQVGFPLAVCNAQPEVKHTAQYVTASAGGHGAVREVIRLLLMAQGKYEAVLAEWSYPC